jgi:hypothetical protein
MGLSLSCLVLLVVCADDPAKRPPDAEVVRLLVGRWSGGSAGEHEPRIQGHVRYKSDGTFEAEGEVGPEKHAVKVTASGTWRVADGALVETVEKCHPPLVRKGHALREEVLAIDSKSMRVRSEKGKESSRERVPD